MNVLSPTQRLRYVAMPEEIADEARETLRDRFGHQLSLTLETGPCRVCLRIEHDPQEMILMSYQPLSDTGPYAELGPIFVHAKRCQPYDKPDEFPKDFASRRLILRAYDFGGRIVDAAVTEPGEAERKAAEFLRSPAVVEVHVRHESYTCYDFKIVRADA